MKEFFIGWHQPNNGRSGCGNFDRTIVSVNRLINRRAAFKVNRWIIDSGAFTRLINGHGHLPPEEYAEIINRWKDNGDLAAAVVQDWLCAEPILKATGLSIADHQRLTIESYDTLLPLINRTYLMPVLQGYAPEEYVKHLKDYGNRLRPGAWVGVGSIAGRSSKPSEIESILLAIRFCRPDLKLHGFGLKMATLKSPLSWDLLYSADSQAHGLYSGSGSNKYARSNDPRIAIEYRDRLLAAKPQPTIWRYLEETRN